MNKMKLGGGAMALMLLTMPIASMAADAGAGKDAGTAQSKAHGPTSPDDVPAPPMALLFGIGAIGLIWGRRLAATARAKRESANPD